MTIAEDEIRNVEAWFGVQSRIEYSRNGRDRIAHGTYAAIVPIGISDTNLPDYTDAIQRGQLPFLTPQGARLQRRIVSVVSNRSANLGLEARLKTILGEIVDWHPSVVVVGLPTNTTSISAALSGAGLGGLDLDVRAVLALPLYALSDDRMVDRYNSVRSFFASKLPIQ